MANLSFRESVRRYVPPWLSDRGERGSVGFRFLYGIASVLDAGAEVLVQGLQARFPGLGSPTALPYIGRDRRIPRGPQQTDAAYAAELLRWLEYWRGAGNAYTLALALQTFLFPGAPQVRLVTRSGLWWTLDPSGELSWHRADPNNWDWDSNTDPEAAGNWSDFWIIVYAPSFGDAGNWSPSDGQAWGPDLAFGVDATTGTIDSIKRLVQQWKGAHTRCVCLIVAYDASSFDPAAAPGAVGMPDGNWGRWSKDDGSGGRVKSRRDDARYVEV
ncbi:hypothetical protein WME76_02335 [Sorangium sp. So ce119]|uniref:hypothetical protein n=1 Tax=Sorangium sp. So ce119 TaxID=3133279 RepID=UPI003F62FE9D